MPKSMLASSSGPNITIWESLGRGNENYNLSQQISPSTSTVSHICWSPNGQWLASSNSNEAKITIFLCDESAYVPVTLIPEVAQPYVRFSNTNSRYFITCGSDSNVRIWDLKSRKVMKTLNTCLYEGITCAAYNPGDSHIASGGKNGTVVITNVVSSSSLSSMVPTYADPQAVSAMEFSSTQKNLLGTVFDDGSCILWDCNTRMQKHSFTHVHVAPATGITFSPVDEMMFVTTGMDKSIMFHDPQSKKTVLKIKAEAPLTSTDFSPNGTYIGVGTYKGSILVYDIRQLTSPVTVIDAHQSPITALKFRKPVKVTKSEALLTSKVSMPSKIRKSKKTMSTSIMSKSYLECVPVCTVAKKMAGDSLDANNMTEHSHVTENMSGNSTLANAGKSAKADSLVGHNFPEILLELQNNINSRMDAMEAEIKDVKNQINNFRDEMKEIIKLQMDNLHGRLHREMINLNVDVIKGFHEQTENIEEMLGYRTLAANLHSEVNELKRENNNLKKHY